MRNPVIFLVLAAACYVTPCTALPAEPAPAEMRLAAQNALFEAQFQSDLKFDPEFATSIGDYRYNDQLNDYSLAAIARAHAADEAFLARLQAIATTGFSEQNTLSHEVMLRMLRQRIDDYRFKEYEMPVNQMDGPHVDLADLPLAVPLNSVKQYEDYIARLHQIPRVFLQTEEVLRAGLKDRLMPVRFLLEKVPEQCQGVVTADPYLLPTKNYPAAIPVAQQQRLTREITDTVTNEVLPAYRAFSAFIVTQYAPHGRTTLSVSSLPGGESRYVNDIRNATSVSNLTPLQIHELGMRETDRIEAERLALAHKAGFADVASLRKWIETNPKYRPTSAQQIVDDYRHYLAQMQPKLPGLFGYIPGSPVTVEALPAFQAAGTTHYQTGTPDGKRPGRVVVATANFAQRTLIDDEATAYHEGIPGHHMQLSVAQQMTSLPKFRQHVHNSGYIEGWALYAEQLGKEIGFYQDPGSDYGRLTSELFRAARLVVDTGLHSQGWTRDQVVEQLRKAGIDEPLVQSESDRYIAWPGQALSYKLGQLKFRELRARAQQALGPKFDIRSFHDEMLNGGVLPLDLLEARTDSWIRAQQRAP
jgi:uncharacterized protein (DUF885 family)